MSFLLFLRKYYSMKEYEHIRGQYATPNGTFELQANYSLKDREIVWLHIFPSKQVGLPSERLELVRIEGVWCFKYNYQDADNNSKFRIYNSEHTNFIIEKLFELLKEKKLTDNKYFH